MGEIFGPAGVLGAHDKALWHAMARIVASEIGEEPAAIG